MSDRNWREFWSTKKRPLWEDFSWFQIGKYAAENGVAATMRFMLRSSFWRKVEYEPGRTPTPEFLSRRVHAVRGGVNQVLWAEQFWNGHPWKLDCEIFRDCPSAKIGPLENFPLYCTVSWYYIEELKHKLTRAVGKPASLCVYKRKWINKSVIWPVWLFTYESTYSGLGKLISNGLQNCLTQNSPLSWSLRWASPVQKNTVIRRVLHMTGTSTSF